MSPIEEKSIENLAAVANGNGDIDTVKRKLEVFRTPVGDGVIKTSSSTNLAHGKLGSLMLRSCAVSLIK